MKKIYIKESVEKSVDDEELVTVNVYLSQPSEDYVLVFTEK